MTRERAKELLPVITAWCEGRHIQARAKSSSFPWFMPGESNYDFEDDNFEWRIKPKPREWWLVKFSAGDLGPALSLESARRTVENFPNAEIIHVREVIE